MRTEHSAGAIPGEATHPDERLTRTGAAGTVCDAGEVVPEKYISDGNDGCRPETSSWTVTARETA